MLKRNMDEKLNIAFDFPGATIMLEMSRLQIIALATDLFEVAKFKELDSVTMFQVRDGRDRVQA